MGSKPEKSLLFKLMSLLFSKIARSDPILIFLLVALPAMGEVPRDRTIWVYCQVGQRAYYATRALRLNGYDARNLTGGFRTYREMAEAVGK